MSGNAQKKTSEYSWQGSTGFYSQSSDLIPSAPPLDSPPSYTEATKKKTAEITTQTDPTPLDLKELSKTDAQKAYEQSQQQYKNRRGFVDRYITLKTQRIKKGLKQKLFVCAYQVCRKLLIPSWLEPVIKFILEDQDLMRLIQEDAVFYTNHAYSMAHISYENLVFAFKKYTAAAYEKSHQGQKILKKTLEKETAAFKKKLDGFFESFINKPKRGIRRFRERLAHSRFAEGGRARRTRHANLRKALTTLGLEAELKEFNTLEGKQKEAWIQEKLVALNTEKDTINECDQSETIFACQQDLENTIKTYQEGLKQKKSEKKPAVAIGPMETALNEMKADLEKLNVIQKKISAFVRALPPEQKSAPAKNPSGIKNKLVGAR